VNGLAAVAPCVPGARTGGWLARAARFPLVRLLTALGFLLPLLVANKLFKTAVYGHMTGGATAAVRYLEAGLFFALFLGAYALYVRSVERRKVLELGTTGWLRELGAGFAVSATLVMAAVAALSLSGCYRVAALNPVPMSAADLLFKFFMGAFLEELLFRLILFRLTEELAGSWAALALQALLFGFAHMANHNATVFTSCAVAVIGGLVYTAAFMATRRLWLPLGLHWGWNFLQSGVFGMPNSGTAYRGLFLPEISGPAWLTGGAFGIEASWVAIGLCLTAGIFLTARATRARCLVPPWWSKGAPG